MIPSLIQKETLKVVLADIVPIFPFFIFVVWLPHALSLPKVLFRFKARRLCSSLGVGTHSFCLMNICSKPLANSWIAFFSSSPLSSLHDRSFNPSVVDEESVLAMSPFFFSIVVFPTFASFGVYSSSFGISAFILDESSISTGLPKSSTFSFPSLIRSWTLYLSAVQFSMG